MTTIAEIREILDRTARYSEEAAARDAEYKIAEERRRIAREEDRRKAEESQRKTDAALRRMEKTISKSVNSFDLKWGRLIESFVNNQAIELFVARGIPVIDNTAQNVTGKIAGKSTEIDVVLVNSDVAVAIEIKTTFHKSDVNHFIYQLKHFREAFKLFARYPTILGAVAYIRAEADVVQYAQESGLFTILATGKSAKIVNDENFEPQKWGT